MLKIMVSLRRLGTTTYVLDEQQENALTNLPVIYIVEVGPLGYEKYLFCGLHGCGNSGKSLILAGETTHI